MLMKILILPTIILKVSKKDGVMRDPYREINTILYGTHITTIPKIFTTFYTLTENLETLTSNTTWSKN